MSQRTVFEYREREDRHGSRDGSGSDEDSDVFKIMDTECKVCMQENKVNRQVTYSVDDLHVD